MFNRARTRSVIQPQPRFWQRVYNILVLLNHAEHYIELSRWARRRRLRGPSAHTRPNCRRSTNFFSGNASGAVQWSSCASFSSPPIDRSRGLGQPAPNVGSIGGRLAATEGADVRGMSRRSATTDAAPARRGHGIRAGKRRQMNAAKQQATAPQRRSAAGRGLDLVAAYTTLLEAYQRDRQTLARTRRGEPCDPDVMRK